MGRFRIKARVLAVAIGVAVVAGAAAAPAQAEFAFETFSFEALDRQGNPEMNAGARPYEVKIAFKTYATPQFSPDGMIRDIQVDLPVGFTGNQAALPRCSSRDLVSTVRCDPATQVGVVEIFTGNGEVRALGVHNMVPTDGNLAQIGFVYLGAPVITGIRLARDGSYRVRSMTQAISQTIPTVGARMTLWGDPTDASHDPLRGEEFGCWGEIGNSFCFGGGEASGLESVAFLVNPTRCDQPPVATAKARSWEEPGEWITASAGADAPLLGCETLPFEPELKAGATSTQADTPTGLLVELTLPQAENPEAVATAHLANAEIRLPEGMAISPSAASGQAACSPAQIGLSNDLPPSCPDASKIGTVTVETPVLDRPLTGHVYLAAQQDNPFGSLLAIYLVAETEGAVIKLPGRIEADPITGRLTTTFTDNPQLPFSKLSVRFDDGERAPLVNPPTCGPAAVEAEFSPWSVGDPRNPAPEEIVHSTDTLMIGSGPNGLPCPASLASRPFDPAIAGGLLNPTAAGSSAFSFKLTRPDGNQELSALGIDLPPGLSAKLAGVPYCPDATLAAISSVPGTGLAETLAPSCPAASRVGTVTVGAGAGATPVYVSTGRAYLAGPYKGAPLSLATVVPALAGPFDLGTTMIRNRIAVDPDDAQVHVQSDPLPTILSGIPLKLRDVRVRIDRPGFMRAPTSCEPMTLAARIQGANGASAERSTHFQVANCERLGFEPKLALRFSGAPPRRGGHPKVTATLKLPEGGANVAKAVVTMPKTQFFENENIRTICTRVQYADENCPKGAVYGYAKAWTPLLDEPLQGPVYLRSSSNTLPDLVADLDGQIDVDLSGRIDSVNSRLRATFWAVPDAPVTKFRLTMQGGRKGLLVNNDNLCRTAPRADVRFTGQNGKVAAGKPAVKVAGCGKKQRK